MSLALISSSYVVDSDDVSNSSEGGSGGGDVRNAEDPEEEKAKEHWAFIDCDRLSEHGSEAEVEAAVGKAVDVDVIMATDKIESQINLYLGAEVPLNILLENETDCSSSGIISRETAYMMSPPPPPNKSQPTLAEMNSSEVLHQPISPNEVEPLEQMEIISNGIDILQMDLSDPSITMVSSQSEFPDGKSDIFDESFVKALVKNNELKRSPSNKNSNLAISELRKRQRRPTEKMLLVKNLNMKKKQKIGRNPTGKGRRGRKPKLTTPSSSSPAPSNTPITDVSNTPPHEQIILENENGGGSRSEVRKESRSYVMSPLPPILSRPPPILSPPPAFLSPPIIHPQRCHAANSLSEIEMESQEPTLEVIKSRRASLQNELESASFSSEVTSVAQHIFDEVMEAVIENAKRQRYENSNLTETRKRRGRKPKMPLMNDCSAKKKQKIVRSRKGKGHLVRKPSLAPSSLQQTYSKSINTPPHEADSKTEAESQPGNIVHLSTCPYCLLIFANDAALINHLKVHERQNGQGSRKLQKTSLIRRSRSHQNNYRYKCTKCEVSYKFKMHLTIHMGLHDASRPFQCSKCDYYFANKRQLRMHERKIHNPGSTKTTSMEVKNSEVSEQDEQIQNGERSREMENDSLLHRTQTQQDGNRFKCAECKASFRAKIFLQLHIPLHDKTKPFKCSKCDYYFIRRRGLQMHEAAKHQSENKDTTSLEVDIGEVSEQDKWTQNTVPQCPLPTICDELATPSSGTSRETSAAPGICKKRVKRIGRDKTRRRRVFKGSLLCPTRTPLNGNKYKCQKCEMSFKNNNMAYHMGLHDTTKPFKCSKCEYYYKTKQGLRLHDTKMHSTENTENNSLEVENCEISAQDKQIQSIGPRLPLPAGCDGLGVSISKKTSAASKICTKDAKLGRNKKGQRKVFGKRKKKLFSKETAIGILNLNITRKTAEENGSLLYQRPVHQNDNRFKCAKCRASFKFKIQLATHMDFHDASKNFQCAKCQYYFTNKVGLQIHERRMHKIQNTTAKNLELENGEVSKQDKQSQDIVPRPTLPTSCEELPTPMSGKSSKSLAASQIGTEGAQSQREKNRLKKVFVKRREAPLQLTRKVKKRNKNKQLEVNNLNSSAIEEPPRSSEGLNAANGTFNPTIIRKLHSCPVCSRSLPSSQRLRSHLLTHAHTKKKPYKCPTCSRGFGLSRRLKLHIRIQHMGKRLYKSPNCSRTLTSRNLKRHLSTHEVLHPYKCPTCSTLFKEFRNLQSHIKDQVCERQGNCPASPQTDAASAVSSDQLPLAEQTGMRIFKGRKVLKGLIQPSQSGSHIFLN